MRTLMRKLGWLLIRRQKEEELREELEFHLAEEFDERRATGLTEAQAGRAARRDLGHLPLVVEDTRSVWGWVLLEQLWQDIRYAARTLARTPSVTVTAVLTLAVGIGLTTAVFSIVYGILIRPLPLVEPNRLVALHTIRQTGDLHDNALSAPNFMNLNEEGSQAFDGLAGSTEIEATLTGVGEARRLDGARVTAGFFEVLNAVPMLGRTFRRAENEPGHHQVVILSHALWQQQFGGHAAVIGQAILLNADTYTVVGMMPRGFDFPATRAFWVPQQYGRNYFSPTSIDGRRGTAIVRVVGRLRRGVGLQTARVELDTRSRWLQARFPETNAGVSFAALPLHDALVSDVRASVQMLLGAVMFVLLIAAANVAGLLLARGASRREEIALRAALGAGRGRIVRQLLTEPLLLGLWGGVLGVLLAAWISSRIVAAQMDGLRRNGFVDAIQLDGPVLTFALGITLLAALLAGLMPAIRTATEGLAGTLPWAGCGAVSSRGQRLRSALVVGQLALAVVLLHGAGLLVNSFIRLTAVDPGFSSDQVLSFRIELPATAYGSPAQVQSFFSGLRERITQHPDVISVGANHRPPIGGGSFVSRFRIRGRSLDDESTGIGVRVITPDYFPTMGVALLRGRGLANGDQRGTLPVVVINEAAAARLFPDEDPIGRQLTDFGYDPLEEAADAFTIVGVVANVRSRGLSEPPQPEAYFAHAQVPLRQMFVFVRSAADPLAQVAAIRTEIQALDRDLPIPEFRALNDVVADSLDVPRFFAALLGIFSATALALAGVGIFGLLSFTVARKTREIAVRAALGASPAILLGAIVRYASLLMALGLAIGLVGALSLARVLDSLLYEISSTDLATLAIVVLTLGVTALVAGIVPAWRATSVDPWVALRAD